MQLHRARTDAVYVAIYLYRMILAEVEAAEEKLRNRRSWGAYAPRRWQKYGLEDRRPHDAQSAHIQFQLLSSFL